ncbi:MAG: AmmeMemoRadiSam system protein B [Candidatus Magasanikbacteria bacterium RIFOXYC2_FULL_42_28]|uniref:AmmeMemoRadiSam system protein B n=1 Tax=Candidatus Magasanikbacteria bacterium RIFOXYC2_FULL_42_28 TaxID=1798704 RepID=A0A1F6NXG8_9BACT|nr:MAG: AmmeMemoRadiSam system protein B [Candidatus Magasanikbacteria bacterium RIFOXYC2_FULL_42_28]
MRIKQVIFLALIGTIGIAVGLAGFWLGPRFKNDQAGLSKIILTGIQLPSEGLKGNVHTAIPNDKDLFETLFKYSQPIADLSSAPVSAVLPHHLVAGSYEIGMLEAVSKKITPAVVVIVSPNHFNTGRGKIITALEPWQTPFGILETNQKIIGKLADAGVMVDDPAIANEHGVGALVSLVKKIWPNTKLVPIIVKNERNFQEIDKVAELLNKILPKNSLVLASVDFSHYLPLTVSNWHDELSINVLETGDYNRLERMEIDSQNSIRLLLKYNELKGAQNFTLAHHTNSADIIKNSELAETTSHVMGYFVGGKPVAIPAIAVQFFGDMMLDRSVAKAMGEKGLDYVFEHLTGQENRFFYGQDLTVANLEGPFAIKRINTSKSIAFRFDPALAGQLKRYNFSAVSLANNHTIDMGRANVDFTKTILEQNNLGYFGNEYSVSTSGIWVANNLPEKMALVGINFTEGEVSWSQIRLAIATAKSQAPNVVVMPHWGQEYDRISNERERQWARDLIDAGATAVVGGHPHVIQEMEIYNGAPIFYSLGNFIFDQYFSQDTQEGFSVGMTFTGGSVKDIYVMPFYSVKSQNYLMSGERRDKFFEWFNTNSRLDGKKFEVGKLAL